MSGVMSVQPGQAGKTMFQTVQDSPVRYHVFQSATDRFGKPPPMQYSRPLGPDTYEPAERYRLGVKDETRPSSVFASKTSATIATNQTLVSGVGRPATSDVDVSCIGTDDAHYSKTNARTQGAHGHRIGKMPSRADYSKSVAKDCDYDPNYGPTVTIERNVATTGRKYTAFQSQALRFPDCNPLGFTPMKGKHNEAQMNIGPGAYDPKRVGETWVRDPKRSTSEFKSGKARFKMAMDCMGEGVKKTEQPDTFRCPIYGRISKDWTSKGSAFSTRERFPKVVPRWKD